MTKRRKQTDTAAVRLFNKGDLIGAKVKGHPLWPGLIEKKELKNNKISYVVRFFGTNETANRFINLKPFDEFTNSEKQCTRKGFREAFILCEEEYNLSVKKNKAQIKEESVLGDEEHQQSQDAPMQVDCSPLQDIPQQDMIVIAGSVSSIATNTSSLSETGTALPLSETPPPSVQQGQLISKKAQPNEKKQSKISRSKNIKLEEPQEQKHEPKDQIHSKPPEVTDEVSIKKRLEAKLKDKLKEKKKCKEKKRYEKLLAQANQKLVQVNIVLVNFLKILQKVSNANTQIDVAKLQHPVQVFESAMKTLAICTQYKTDMNGEEFALCHERLSNIIGLLKATRRNHNVPSVFRNDARKLIRSMKHNPSIKNFLNSYLDNQEEKPILEDKERRVTAERM